MWPERRRLLLEMRTLRLTFRFALRDIRSMPSGPEQDALVDATAEQARSLIAVLRREAVAADSVLLVAEADELREEVDRAA